MNQPHPATPHSPTPQRKKEGCLGISLAALTILGCTLLALFSLAISSSAGLAIGYFAEERSIFAGVVGAIVAPLAALLTLPIGVILASYCMIPDRPIVERSLMSFAFLVLMGIVGVPSILTVMAVAAVAGGAACYLSEPWTAALYLSLGGPACGVIGGFLGIAIHGGEGDGDGGDD